MNPTPYRGSRCPKCFWALYDGDFCQNSKCRNYQKSIPEPVFLSNEEAAKMIATATVQTDSTP